MHLLLAETIQLFPDGTLFIHIALILIMIWVLNRTLYRPINQVLEARERNKGGHSSEAASILRDAETKEQRYTRELLEARSAGYEMIEKEQKAATSARDQLMNQVKTEVTTKLETGRTTIEQDTTTARATIKTDAERLADQIAASILKA